MALPETILFDIDGTLAGWKTRELLPGVAEWFTRHAANHKIALVTNQGGVGLRLWMEDGGFGDPSKYPTEDQARQHIDAVNDALPGGPYPVFVCFAYKAKSGNWDTTSLPDHDDPEWDRKCRKPAPGMIYNAIRELRTTRAKTMFVGDQLEDREAALNASVGFQDAEDFFGRAIPF